MNRIIDLVDHYFASNMVDQEFISRLTGAYITYLIEDYIGGNMSDDSFSITFEKTYNNRFSGEGFSEEELTAIRRLSEVAGRYSSSENDLKIQNAFFGSQDLYAAALIAGEALGLQ